MSIFSIILIVALTARFIIDLLGLFKNSYKFDIAYALLFFVVGLFSVLENMHDYFGYISLLISAFYGFLFLKKAKGFKDNF